MSKFGAFTPNENYELVFEQDGYSVYNGIRHARYYLVKNGKCLAGKNNCTSDVGEWSKWIKKFEKNALDQLERLDDRIDELVAERDEVWNVLNTDGEIK